MIKQELIELLNKLKDMRDIAERHHLMDSVLLEYINDPEVSAIYNSVTKWYE